MEKKSKFTQSALCEARLIIKSSPNLNYKKEKAFFSKTKCPHSLTHSLTHLLTHSLTHSLKTRGKLSGRPVRFQFLTQEGHNEENNKKKSGPFFLKITLREGSSSKKKKT